MKNILLLCLTTVVSTSAFALQNLTCTLSGLENAYQVLFSEDGIATVLMNNQPVEFGNLTCSKENEQSVLIAQCYSKNVFDGGFSVNLNMYDQCGMKFVMADLYEVSFIGKQLLGSFPCLSS